MDTLGTPAFGSLLVLGAAAAVALAGGWLLLIGAAAVVEAGSRGRWQALRWTGCPLSWRRRLLGLLAPVLAPGVGLGTAPAVADPGAAGPDGPAGSPVAAHVVGLPLPDRQPGHGRRPRPEPPADGAVVVVGGGDTLWTIAARDLPGAPAAEIARRCSAIYRANRSVVGDDPDLILPGQRLRLPPAGPADPPNSDPHPEENR